MTQAAAEPKTSGVVLREARAKDRPALVSFMQDMGHRLGRPRPDALTSEARLALMLSVDHDPWLIERDERAIGYVLARENGDHVHIRHFLIAESERGRGVGKAVMALLSEEYGDPVFRLDVLNGDDDALAFWKEIGFAPHAVHMRRDPDTA